MKPRHLSKIRKLHEKADACMRAGDFERGRALSEEAAHLAVRRGGLEDPDVGYCFFHIANIQEHVGDLTGAEQSYNAAYGILNATEGEATPLKAEVLLRYGSLYLKMGLGWRAILLLDHAKGRFLEILGPNDESVGRCLSMIALAYERLQLDDEAVAAYDEAIRILRADWGPTHPSVAHVEWSRVDLAFWRASKDGDPQAVDQALADIRGGLSRLEEVAGRDHPDAARRRAQLGSCLVVSGQFEEGATLLSDALAILEDTGENVAAFRRQLATARARLGDWAEALALLRRSIAQDPLGQRVAHGSDRERMGALEQAHENLAQYLDLVLRAANDDPSIVREACNLVLSRKALGAELLFTQRQAVSRGDNPELAPLMERLADLRARSAQRSLAGGGVDETLVEIERVEWELASRIPEMEVDPGLAEFTHESASALLPDASALIEFVRFTRRATAPADPDALEDGSRDWYVAFVIPSGADGDVRLIDLGSAPEIDRLIGTYRGSLSRSGADREAGQARDLSAAPEDDTGDNGVDLRARIFDPLLPALGQRTRLVIAPDGDVTRIPFEALPDASGGFLIDSLDISYLSAGRDLKRLASYPAGAIASDPLVMADPDYDLEDETKKPPGGPRSPVGDNVATAATPGDREQLRRDLTRNGIHFGRLPGTRAEGIAVAGLLRVEPLLGEAAREERLKTARSPLVLHVATHGFFLSGPAHEEAPDTDVPNGRLATAARNPLVRSGIAVAGANAWLRGDPRPDNIDDGIVNGEDIVSMDLTATELVVLSACETGLGDLVAGEGVMGLRRAFAVAGARTLVLSLWKVPDDQTRMLMTCFYEGLIDGNGRAESLRGAQRRVRVEHPEPFYWAAFICQGDPGPMPSFSAAVAG